MTVDAQRLSPLAGWRHATGDVSLAEVPFLTQLDLRTRSPESAAVALPVQPCSSVRTGEYELLWLGPDEWLLLAPDGAVLPEVGAVSVTDVSAQRTAVTLSGAGARALLAKGCSIDFYQAAVGTCVQTLLAQTGVIIVVRSETEYLLLVRASFAGYLADWLTDAAIDLT